MLRLGLMVALLAGALVAPIAAFASDGPDDTVAHDPQNPNGNTNETPFWEWYFENKFPGTDWECTKVDSPTDPTITDIEDAVIIKASTSNYVWWDDPNTTGPNGDELHSGTYSPPEHSTSHYITCVNNTEPVEDDIDPDGEIGGPCDDPAHYAIFDNSESTVAVTFRFRFFNNAWRTIVKTVPGGMVFRTFPKWIKPNTVMRIGWFDTALNRWVNLDMETAGKGYYPTCEYDRGLSEHPIGHFESDNRQYRSTN
jgi:hypothetical protein